ncbi:MAG: phosphoribosylformylglycinamidine synthase subunit PurQ, partial [Bacteroidales bacterium]|nr:phosphoribosylformylglycinamidine synthase subunit PurQ [Bacteroidales bacterium]
WAVGFGGVAEAVAKMSFGNSFGAEIECSPEDLFSLSYGSIVVESASELDFPQAVLLGKVSDGEDGYIRVNGEKLSQERLLEAWRGRYKEVYPQTAAAAFNAGKLPSVHPVNKKTATRPHGKIEGRPLVYLPVFPGTNCDYDTAKAFRAAGAETRFGVFCNLDAQQVNESIERMRKNISECQILALSGGFSSGDEPDGSGKFIASVLNNATISKEIDRLLERGGLILGICNGFQALVKSGLLPYGRTGCVTTESPTLFRNDINRHVSQMVTTRVACTSSPWLAGMHTGDIHAVAVSHGEGKFTVSDELARQLFANGQVAFQYVDPVSEEPTMESPYNPNGSNYAIEGIISPDGQILGKMGHSERWEEGLFKNIPEDMKQPIFENAVRYFTK